MKDDDNRNPELLSQLEIDLNKRYTREEIAEMSSKALAIAQTTEDRFPASMVAETLDDYLLTERVPAEKRQMAIQQVMQGRLEMTVNTQGLYPILEKELQKIKRYVSGESKMFKYSIGGVVGGLFTTYAGIPFEHPSVTLTGLGLAILSAAVCFYDQVKKQISRGQPALPAPQPAEQPRNKWNLPTYDKPLELPSSDLPIVGDLAMIQHDGKISIGLIHSYNERTLFMVSRSYEFQDAVDYMKSVQIEKKEVTTTTYLQRKNKITEESQLEALAEGTLICVDTYDSRKKINEPLIEAIGILRRTPDNTPYVDLERKPYTIKVPVFPVAYFNFGNDRTPVKSGTEIYTLEVKAR